MLDFAAGLVVGASSGLQPEPRLELAGPLYAALLAVWARRLRRACACVLGKAFLADRGVGLCGVELSVGNGSSSLLPVLRQRIGRRTQGRAEVAPWEQL